jgi:hypothetical protein
VGASAALPLLLGHPSGALAASARVYAPVYEQARQTLIVPFRGGLPRYHLETLAIPYRIVLDFTANPGFEGHVSKVLARSAWLSSWTIAWRGPGEVRLTLSPKGLMHLGATSTSTAWYFYPQGLSGIYRAKSSVRSFRGFTPRPSVRRSKQSPLIATPIPYPSEAPPVYNPPAYAPGPQPTYIPAPSLQSPAQFPRVLPPTPRVNVPLPEVSPGQVPDNSLLPQKESELPQALPSTLPLAAAHQLPMGFALSLMNTREKHPAGNIDLTAGNLLGLEATLGGFGSLGLLNPESLDHAWFGRARLGELNYSFNDRDLPLSQHSRQEWLLSLAFARQFAWGPVETYLGPGYFLKYESSASSGAPPVPSEAFSSFRLFQGPSLVAALNWRLIDTPVGALSLDFDGEAQPFVFSALDSQAGSLPYLFGTRARLGLRWNFGFASFKLAYERQALDGPGYSEDFSGPLMALHGSFP